MRVNVTLLPWEPRVSDGHRCIDVTIHGGRVAIENLPELGDRIARGWFGVYERRVFGVFECQTDNDGSVGVALLVAGKMWMLTPSVQLISSRTSTHRSLTVKEAGRSEVFRYHRFWWNFVRRPGNALSEVLLVDDWWGVVCDLPGWVAARWNAGKLAEELSEGLVIRRHHALNS